MASDGEKGLLLGGIDGANPLGFLAALGLFRIVAEKVPESRIRWSKTSRWVPSIRGVGTSEDLLDVVIEGLRSPPPEEDPAFALGFGSSQADKLTEELDSYRAFCRDAATRSSHSSRRAADFALSWRSDGGADSEYVRGRKGRTDFDFTAGNQKLLAMVRDVASATGRQELERTLLEFWDYGDQSASLRWDPLDETRQYAVQFFDPAGNKNPIRTMTGANRLAVEALPWLPVLPTSRGLRTTGFQETEGVSRFVWPIWSVWMSAEVVPPLLASPELRLQGLDQTVLRRRGVEEVFEACVVMPSGRYRCFSPSRKAVRPRKRPA